MTDTIVARLRTMADNVLRSAGFIEDAADALCEAADHIEKLDALVVSVRMALALVGGLDEEELSRAHDRRMESLALALATLDAQEEKQ